MRRWLLAVGLLGALALVGVLAPLQGPIEPAQLPVSAAAETVEVIPGSRYRGGILRKFFLGASYRHVWTEPVVIPVLSLDRFDGGLWPVREGGGQETRSLHLVSDSGRRWIFRSVDKERSRLLPRPFRRGLLAWMVQDQVAATHPGGILVAAPLQRAVGLPGPETRLVLLPDQERLGPFGSRFGGLLGVLQEVPEQWTGVRSTAEVVALEDSGRARLDRLGFLTARFLDLVLNDWDRHPGQWRWAADSTGRDVWWRPIPVDRDQALSRYDGVLVRLARIGVPQLARFTSEPDLRALGHNSRELDCRLLAGVARQPWDSVARFVAARLGDSVIDAAVARMPAAWRRVSGPTVAGLLKQRRDRLPDIASRFYASLH